VPVHSMPVCMACMEGQAQAQVTRCDMHDMSLSSRLHNSEHVYTWMK
jgi:hypothetical protein